MGCTTHIFIWWSMFMVANMTLLINDNDILFNHMDPFCSFLLRHSYSTTPDYQVVKVWIRATVLFGYWIPGIACQCIVDMVDVLMWHIFCYDHMPFFATQNYYFVLTGYVWGISVASLILAWCNFLHALFLSFTQCLCLFPIEYMHCYLWSMGFCMAFGLPY